MFGLTCENMRVKFDVRRFNRFGAISIYRLKNFGGHVIMAMPPFGKILRGHVRTVPGNMKRKYICQI